MHMSDTGGHGFVSRWLPPGPWTVWHSTTLKSMYVWTQSSPKSDLHRTSDCWIIIDGEVYDVTDFLPVCSIDQRVTRALI